MKLLLAEVPLDLNDAEDEEVQEKKELSILPLERCMRIIPHDQDTRAFLLLFFRRTLISLLSSLNQRNHRKEEI
jgi:hypothetical protein